MRDDIDIEALRQRLLDRARELEAMAETRRQAGRTVELDQSRTGRLSRMDAMQAQAMAHAGEARAQDEYRRIQAALKRIDSGDYGDCLDCGDPIGAGRLNFDPAITLCLACAEQREQR
ncbi:TraR/DksA family transcriptional regulator [Thiohalobacter thiocyanaticus]|uniref:TraR/DksA family transcriptional regulator n=2 Tax=Thiohalobacter thiocyanaticus TaxID=585455 RepID=A0A426QJ52_9GAMM|nr:TraR/DksA family transcriptional regulator [Thiohalobacter thiocyanaticus]